MRSFSKESDRKREREREKVLTNMRVYNKANEKATNAARYWPSGEN